ncbi:MAG: tripartite tricarboxylate transporter TctB family protein [Burkholderiales bacterium]
MHLTRDRAAALALAACAATALWAARRYPFGTLAEPGPGLVPLLLAALLLAGALGLAVHGGAATRLREVRLNDLPLALLLLALMGVATFALERIGYRATAAGFLFALLAVVERRPWWIAALLAGGFALGSFWVVNNLLRVPLPVNDWGW